MILVASGIDEEANECKCLRPRGGELRIRLAALLQERLTHRFVGGWSDGRCFHARLRGSDIILEPRPPFVHSIPTPKFALLSKTLRAFRALSRDLYKAEAGLTSLLPLIPDYLQRL